MQELYPGHAGSLSLDVGPLPRDQLRSVTGALLAAVRAAGSRPPRDPGLACARCEGVLRAPVTADCGHTFCRKCAAKAPECGQCGQSVGEGAREVNVMVRGLTEKWWAADVEAAERREQGDEMYERGETEAALAKYDQAIELAPHDHRAVSARSRALHRLSRLQAALADADAAVRMRPAWGTGHYRRGVALSSMGRHQDALVSLCVSVALDRQLDASAEVSRALRRLLGVDPAPVTAAAPYARSRKHRFVRRAKRCSDTEDDGCEEDANQLHRLVDRVLAEASAAWSKCGVELAISPALVDRADFECVLCCRLLCHPVTTPCGHTYCLACLDRCLDYSLACPLCNNPLQAYLSGSQRSTTLFLERALTLVLPGAYSARQLTLGRDLCYPSSRHVPVFVCTTAFPGVPCPLFVYEPRYRNMVRRCVQASTQFGIAACLGKEPGARRYADFGTLQEIMDCVLMPDGCSIITTVGRRRFKVIGRSERDGYDTAQVEFLRDQQIEPGVLQGLRGLHDRVRRKSCKWLGATSATMQAEIKRTFGEMPAVEDDWFGRCDGPAWAWWLLAILPLGPRLQVGILSTTALEKRLRAIEKMLLHMQHNRVKPSAQLSSQSEVMEVDSAVQAAVS